MDACRGRSCCARNSVRFFAPFLALRVFKIKYTIMRLFRPTANTALSSSLSTTSEKTLYTLYILLYSPDISYFFIKQINWKILVALVDSKRFDRNSFVFCQQACQRVCQQVFLVTTFFGNIRYIFVTTSACYRGCYRCCYRCFIFFFVFCILFAYHNASSVFVFLTVPSLLFFS